MRKLLLITGSFFVLFSCNSSRDITKNNIYQILSILIDEFGKPIIPPPSPNKEDFYYTNKQIDSITNQKQTIGLHPFFIEDKIEEKTLMNFIKDTAYLKLLNKNNSFNNLIKLDTNFIKARKNYKIVYIDSALSKQKQYRKYNKQLFFSKVLFNKKEDKAILTISVKYNAQYLCLFEKKDGNWIIKKTKILLIT